MDKNFDIRRLKLIFDTRKIGDFLFYDSALMTNNRFFFWKNRIHRLPASMNRIFLLVVLTGLFLLGAQAPSDAGAGLNQDHGTALTSPPARSVNDNVLRFGVHVSEMGTMDPHFAAGSQDRALADMVFNGLLRYQPGKAPQIEPDLAEQIPDFTMEEGRQVWRIALRKGVMFHSGPRTEKYELTADDVVFSLKKSSDSNLCAYSGEYAGMAVEKIDRYTVKISLENPLSSILFFSKLTNYGGGFIVSKKAMDAMGYEQYKTHPVGTGPFAFKEYLPGRKLILEANKDYFRGRPLLDGVEIHFHPGIEEREAQLESGQLDVIMGSGETGWIESMEALQGTVVDTHGVGEVVTIYFNTAMAPLTDIRVRRAMAYALDRKAFMDTSNRRITGEVYSPVPDRFLPGGLTKKEAGRLGLAYDTDLDKAKQLLTEAGYPDGFHLELVSSEKRIYRSIYYSLARQLARIGIICHINVETHSTMHRMIRSDLKPIVIYMAWRPNADVFLTRFFYSDSIVVSGAKPDTNFSHYTKVDNLIESARLEIDPVKQTRLWVQAQIRILNDMIAYPVMFINQCYARRAYVDYGHPLISTMALYPQFTEKTRFIPTARVLPGKKDAGSVRKNR